MEGQAVSFNQAFRDRIAGYMKAILIFNVGKVASALGSLIAAIFIKVNLDKYAHNFLNPITGPIYPSPALYALPIAGSAVSLLASAVVVFIFTSNDRKEHFITNVILYRILVAMCQLPLAGGFGICIYYNILLRTQLINSMYADQIYLPIIMVLVFSGINIFFFGLGSAICMRRISVIKFFMFLTNARAAGGRPAARPNRSKLSAGFSAEEPRV